MLCRPSSLARWFIACTKPSMLPYRRTPAALAASLPEGSSIPQAKAYSETESPSCSPIDEPST